MTPPPPPPATLVTAYRHLLRAALRAVQFSKPARYVVRDRIREAFERPGTVAYDAERVRRTVWFLKAAVRETGLETRILKGLVRVAWERRAENGPRTTWKGTLAVVRERETGRGRKEKIPSVVTRTAYHHYELTVKMLNDTMGLCLR